MYWLQVNKKISKIKNWIAKVLTFSTTHSVRIKFKFWEIGCRCKEPELKVQFMYTIAQNLYNVVLLISNKVGVESAYHCQIIALPSIMDIISEN